MSGQHAGERKQKQPRMFWLAIALAASFWVVDSFLDAYINRGRKCH